MTAREREMSFDILAAYNKQTGQSFTASTWHQKIIMRIREHPNLTANDHHEIIRRNLSDPWWKGDPTPSVIYGNDAVFEKAMQTKTRSSEDLTAEQIFEIGRTMR